MPIGIYKRKLKAKHPNMSIYASSRKADISPHWKGGVLIIDGYRWLYNPHHPNATKGRRYIAEHRMVMSEFLGRPLLSSELIHHLNGNRLDNRLDNLIIVSRKKHNHIHHSNPSHKTRMIKRKLAYERKDPNSGRFR
jgi:hypothetical protein